MRTDKKRSKKYKKKLTGDTAKARIDAYGKEQKKHFNVAVAEQVRIEQEVKRMIQDRFIMYYMVFAKQVVKLQKKYQGSILSNELHLLQITWRGRGLDIELLDKIKNYYVPSFIIRKIFRLDQSLLDGPDVLG